MESPERPTEDQILDWLRLYVPEWHQSWQVGARTATLPDVARVLWLRHCAAPPLTLRAVADELGVSQGVAVNLARRGLPRRFSVASLNFSDHVGFMAIRAKRIVATLIVPAQITLDERDERDLRVIRQRV